MTDKKIIDAAPVISKLAEWALRAKGIECSIVGEVIDVLIAAPEVPFDKDINVPSWIPVTERLPAEREAVLCIGTKGGMFISNHWRESNTAPGGKIWINGQGWRTFTHWIPLPQPPEEGK